jgi:hypothetical protein
MAGRGRRVRPGSGHNGVVRPDAAPAPRFRAATRRAAAGARTPAAARVWRNPREPPIMLNEDRRRTAPRSDERSMVRRRHSCCAYPIARLPDIGLAHRAALLNRALTCPPDGSRRGETAPSRCAVWRLMRCLVLGDDRCRNAAALAHLVSALPSPSPDLCAALTTRASSGATTPTTAAALPSVVDV